MKTYEKPRATFHRFRLIENVTEGEETGTLEPVDNTSKIGWGQGGIG